MVPIETNVADRFEGRHIPASRAVGPVRAGKISLVGWPLLILWLTAGQTLVTVILDAGFGISGFVIAPYLNFSALAAASALYCYFIAHAFFAKDLGVPRGATGVWMATLVVVTVVGFFVGALSENSTLYLFTDTLYFVNWIMGGLVAGYVFKQAEKQQLEQLLRWLGYVLFSALIISALLRVVLNAPTLPTVIRISQCYLVLCLFYKPIRNPILIATTVAFVAGTLLGVNRGSIIMLFAILVFASWACRRGYLSVGAILIPLIAGPGLLILAIEVVPPDTPLGFRLLETQNFVEGRATTSNSLAALQRVYEAEAVTNRYIDEPEYLMTGFGAGATISARSIPGIEVYEGSLGGLEGLHNIHFLHTALYYRHGLLGLAMLAAIGTLLILAGIGLRRGRFHSQAEFGVCALATFYCLGTVIYAEFASNALFSDPLFGFLLGTALILSARPPSSSQQFSRRRSIPGA